MARRDNASKNNETLDLTCPVVFAGLFWRFSKPIKASMNEDINHLFFVMPCQYRVGVKYVTLLS